jgi:putative salt-induced outer membrane protein YdiY
MNRALALVFFASLAVSQPLLAQDFILHVDGDSINGEVKNLKRGKISFEIPGGSATAIEWDNIAGIGTAGEFDIELTEKRRGFGRLAPGPEPGTAYVMTAADTVVIPLADFVEMVSVEGKFWSRFDGFLEFGFSFAKANSATNYNLAMTIDYRAPKWILGFDANSRLQRQDGAEDTKRSQFTLRATYLFPKSWTSTAFFQAEQNEELDLDLRLLFGIVGGRDFISTSRVNWNASVGVVVNDEDYVGVPSNTSTEAVVGTAFNFFSFGDFENDLVASLLVYPSLTQSGRIRTDADLKYRQELFADFYFSLSFYHTYDSEPPTGGESTDYGTSLSLGWDF